MHVLVLALMACVPEESPTVPTAPCVPRPWYADRDGDGVRGADVVESCSGTDVHRFPDPSDPVDCDDDASDTHPGALESCDGRDQDCDGEVDEDAYDPRHFTPDADGDGHGEPGGAGVTACDPPVGHTDGPADDCDDTRGDVFPGADEVCDALDQDCDGFVDEQPVDGTRWWWDVDEDGYGDDLTSEVYCEQPLGTIAIGGDCDDSDYTIHPGGIEACNGLDDDCDGVLDQGLPQSTYFLDLDGDGFGDELTPSVQACAPPPLHVAAGGDCDDLLAEVWPGAHERCNGLDDDCDGSVADEIADEDGDGFSVCDGDCDDTAVEALPGGAEVCDAVDNDCNGSVNDPWLDLWEPNDERVGAPRVADDNEVVVLTPSISGPGDHDWFEMDTFDNAGTIPDTFRAWARVEDIPPGVEVALHLYRNNVLGQARHVMTDDTWQDGVLEVERTGLWPGNDGNLYWVGVEVLAGYSCDETYTLTLGNQD